MGGAADDGSICIPELRPHELGFGFAAEWSRYAQARRYLDHHPAPTGSSINRESASHHGQNVTSIRQNGNSGTKWHTFS